jgi:hypothetical protein
MVGTDFLSADSRPARALASRVNKVAAHLPPLGLSMYSQLHDPDAELSQQLGNIYSERAESVSVEPIRFSF